MRPALIFLSLCCLAFVELVFLANIGFGAAVAVSLITAAIGAWYIRLESLDLWSAIESGIKNGYAPPWETLDTMLMVWGGWLLLTPGLITDVVGALFVIPITRAMLNPQIGNLIRKNIN